MSCRHTPVSAHRCHGINRSCRCWWGEMAFRMGCALRHSMQPTFLTCETTLQDTMRDLWSPRSCLDVCQLPGTVLVPLSERVVGETLPCCGCRARKCAAAASQCCARAAEASHPRS